MTIDRRWRILQAFMASQTKELLRQTLIRDQRTPSPRPQTPSLRPSTSSRLGRVGGGELDMSRAGPTAGPGSSSPSKNVVDRGVLMRKLLLNPVPAAERWYVLLAAYTADRARVWCPVAVTVSFVLQRVRSPCPCRPTAYCGTEGEHVNREQHARRVSRTHSAERQGRVCSAFTLTLTKAPPATSLVAAAAS